MNREIQPMAWPVVGALAGAVAAVLTATSWPDGYFGDELYFIAAGHHPAWGYADQPPLLPLLARTLDSLGPGQLWLLRLPAALTIGAGVIVTALLAREFGGGRRAQVMAAAAWAISLETLGVGHTLSTATFDVVLWAVVSWLVVRWLRTRDDRLLLWAGLATAIDLEVKYLIPLFWGALLVAALAAGRRDLLRRPALWAGLVLAAASAVPGLLWQARHGWPQVAVSHTIARNNALLFGGRLTFVPFVLLSAGVVVGAVLAVYGWWRLIRSPEAFLGWTVAGVCVVTVAGDGRFYYVAGLFALCWASGAVAVERGTPARWWRWAVSAPAYVVSAVLAIVLVVHVPLPDRLQLAIGADGTHQWAALADDVAAAFDTLPPAERDRSALVASTYWVAGALAELGPSRSLPSPYSPARGYYYFGMPPATDVNAVFVGGPAPSAMCRVVDQAASLAVPAAVQATNTGLQGRMATIWICRGRDQSWPAIWQARRQI